MKTLLNNCRLSNHRSVSIVIENGVITALYTPVAFNASNYDHVYEINNQLVMPGMIDIHTHMRDLELSHKETYLTGSRACLENGITTFCDMPNSIPSTKNLVNLNIKLEKINESLVEHYVYIGLDEHSTYEEVSEMLQKAVGIKIFLSHTTGNMIFDWTKLDERIFGLDTLYLFHAEGKAILEIPTIIKNCETKIHICHVSSKQEYLYAMQVKKTHQNLTVGITPHHLLLCANSLNNPNLERVKPSLKSQDDCDYLLQLLIDQAPIVFETDHAPHTLEEKLEKGLFGFPGVDTALNVLLTFAHQKKISYKYVEQIYSLNPSRVIGLKRHGKIDLGYAANLIVVDENHLKTISHDKMKTKCKWSPFHNHKFYGLVNKVFIKGKLNYDLSKNYGITNE